MSSGKFTDYEVRGDFGEVPLGSTKIPSTFGAEVEKLEVTFPKYRNGDGGVAKVGTEGREPETKHPALRAQR